MSEKHCAHPDAYVEKACCSPLNIFIECACGGRDVAVCPNKDCDGITDDEAEDIIGHPYFALEDACYD